MEECDLCGREAKLVGDHCHRCDTMRGRICRACNKYLDDWGIVWTQKLADRESKTWRYLDKSHFPGVEPCMRAAMLGVAYSHWVAAGRPWDWWNTYCYGWSDSY